MSNEKEKPDNATVHHGLLPRLRDVLGLLSAVAGIFIALLWLGGRSYAAGYFGAMNIPSYQVSFSIWEYAEAAWLPLIFYVAFTTIVVSAISETILLLTNPLFVRIADWQHKSKTSNKSSQPPLVT